MLGNRVKSNGSLPKAAACVRACFKCMCTLSSSEQNPPLKLSLVDGVVHCKWRLFLFKAHHHIKRRGACKY